MSSEQNIKINRRPAVAGSFYPASRNELEKELKVLLSAASEPKMPGNIVALVSPHAGYFYSGGVAASAFNQLEPDRSYDNVFLIGSSHYASFEGAAIYTEGDYFTPLGVAKVNTSLTKKLVADHPDIFRSDRDIQAGEHSLEVQLPFLQYIYKDRLRIVPLVIGSQRSVTVKKISDALAPYFEENNLFVISTDFSHYPDYENACAIDEATAGAIMKNSPEIFMQAIGDNKRKGIPGLSTCVCGWTSVLTLLNLTGGRNDIKIHEISYKNSGDAPYGDRSRVVGYHAMAVTKGLIPYFSDMEKEALLKIARTTLEYYLENGKIPGVSSEEISGNLNARAGVFVSLKSNEKLRGCIGRFDTCKPLYRTVQEMAVSAAIHDYRFAPLDAAELNKVRLDISVLSPMRLINSIDEIVPGKHGIYIKKDEKTGTYLPHVAEQTGWNAAELVKHCSHDKAGLGWDGWQDADIYVYETCTFGER